MMDWYAVLAAGQYLVSSVWEDPQLPLTREPAGSMATSMRVPKPFHASQIDRVELLMALASADLPTAALFLSKLPLV